MIYMEIDEKKIYRLDDEISFRQCSLYSGKGMAHGNCTNFEEREENWKRCYYCNQQGVHLHCTLHPAIELDVIDRSYRAVTLKCPKCNKEIKRETSFDDIINKCLRMLNIETFKDATLIRLDDWYVPEVKKKEKIGSEYWVNADVKTDKDGDTIVVLYVGHTGAREKAQFFIKPEKCQLTSDHKDMDPSKVISRIEVTLKDRKLIQEYGE